MKGLAAITVTSHLVGIAFFLAWLSRTDIMFGHFRGPPILLAIAIPASGLGLALSLAWFGLAFARFRATSPTAPRQGRRWPAVLWGVVLSLLGLLSCLVVLWGSSEFPRSLSEHRW